MDECKFPVHRSQAEMREIKTQYMMVYGRELISDIRSKCSGDYEKVGPRQSTCSPRHPS